jgi:nicotinamidase-related amidase
MTPPAQHSTSHILTADESLLVIVDAQEHFLGKLDRHVADAVTQRIAWLAAFATWLAIPVIATAEERERHGGVALPIAHELPSATPTFDKPVFDLAATPAILESVAATGRRTAVLVGLESDVCLLQSAFGLLDVGYRVAVVQDAVAAPGAGHQAGLARMHALGVELLTVKGLFYEWTRTVARAECFLADRADLGAPHGIVL